MSFLSWAKRKKEQAKALFRKSTPPPRKVTTGKPQVVHAAKPSGGPPGKATNDRRKASSLKLVVKSAGKMLQKMRDFKKSTNKKVGSQKVGQTVSQCVPIRRKGIPCDLSELVLTEKGGRKDKSRKAVYVRAGQASKGQLVSGKVFEVVAGARNKAPVTTLEVDVRTDTKYCGRHGHPVLVIEPMSLPATTHKGATSSQSVGVWRRARLSDDSAALDYVLAPVWMASHTPNVFTFTARACGRRPEGSITRALTAQVHVYPDDQYSLSITLPTFSSETKSRGEDYLKDERYYRREVTRGEGVLRRRENTYERTYRQNEKGQWRAHGKARRKQKTSGRTVGSAVAGIPPNLPGRPAGGDREPNVSIQLLRNGVECDALKRLAQIVDLIVNFRQRLEEIKRTLLSVDVQVGWRFDINAALFEGTLTGNWGWQEHTDHRVFFGYGIEVDLMLIDLSASVSFGFEARWWKLQLTAKVEGTLFARYSLDGSLERVSPDTRWPTGGELPSITGTYGASLSAHVVALRPEVFELYGEVKSGIVVTGKLHVEPASGFYLLVDATWTGITARGRVQGWFGGKDRSIKLMKERPLVKGFRLPAADKQEQPTSGARR